MRKILFTIATFYGGGAERALSNIVTHFPDDWDIDILINSETPIDFPHKGNMLSLSMPGFGEKKSILYFIKETVKRVFYLRKIKKSNNYDACISFLDSANISNILSGKKYCKTVVSIRVDMTAKRSKWLYRISAIPLIKFLYSHADKIVVVSNEIELGLVQKFKLPKSKIQTIVNGYDCLKIQRQMKVSPPDGKQYRDFMDGKKVVVSVGRVDIQKGHWHLIRAFSEVVKVEPQAVLSIVGTGALEGYLLELIENLGLKRNVALVGHSDNPFWYNAHADVFVLPSMYEGYPNALAEAVCCGAPCIATDFHSGAREILAPKLDVMGERVKEISEEEYGILVPICSGRRYKGNEPLEQEELKLAEAITMLLKDTRKQKYYREKSIERSNDLEINAIVDKWIDVILGKK